MASSTAATLPRSTCCAGWTAIPELPAARLAGARSGRDGRVRQRAAAHREVWQPWTVGEVSDEDYAGFMRLPGYERELDIVAVAPDGTVAAYVNGWLDPLNRIGDFGPSGRGPPTAARV